MVIDSKPARWALVLLMSSVGCYGGVDELAADGGPWVTVEDDPSAEGSEPAEESEPAAPTLDPERRLSRLSHLQWENSVRDLLYATESLGVSDAFIDDPSAGRFDNQGGDFEVGATLWGDYQRAAERVADRVLNDPDILARIVTPDPGASQLEGARRFVSAFGARAFRRPLTPDELDDHVELFTSAGPHYESRDDFEAGVHMVVQAMLQSPHFLYRVVDGEVDEDGWIRLDAFERASRLSYALWNTMPDEPLFAAAAEGSLNSREGLVAHVERMLEDPRARGMVNDFHAQLLDYEQYLDRNRDPERFPEFDPQLGELMQQEARMFVEDIVFERGEGYAALLTATNTFANDALAPIYGLEPNLGDAMVPVSLDPTRRSGLLTRSGFLMSRSHRLDPDPIHRGSFISFELLCNEAPPVPDAISSVEPDPTRTNRERVNAHTGAGTCGAGCHTVLINDAGFAFEHYDAVGSWRDVDNGQPVDSAASFRFDGELRSFDDAVDFSHRMADSHQAHACYSRHLFEYLHGRRHREHDASTIDQLGARSLDGALSIREMIVELVTSDDFLRLHHG